MRILMLQGPGQASTQLDGEVAANLWRTAWRAGHALHFQANADIAALASSIRATAASQCGFILLDAGSWPSSSRESREDIRRALDELAAPVVEVCARSDHALEFPERASCRLVATIIIGTDALSRFRVALGIALRRLSLAPPGARAQAGASARG